MKLHQVLAVFFISLSIGTFSFAQGQKPAEKAKQAQSAENAEAKARRLARQECRKKDPKMRGKALKNCVDKKVSKPGNKPASKPGNKPESKPGNKPAGNPGNKPSEKKN